MALKPGGPICADGSGVTISVKAVPGAKRDEIVGLLGERLKVRVSAPPEDGRANRAVCRLVAGALGLPGSAVSVVRGQSNPEKTLRAEGIDLATAVARLGVRL